MDNLNTDSLATTLGGLEYPCDRRTVILHAAAEGADDDLLGHLCALPERQFDGAEDVNAALSSRARSGR
ncbi:DUF2795 domain-containing protein [Sciscionella marina]|uniref:DUF2795 domain-containing protein n=1 Tax=Sciscionella marina TaxID=508770 RepID=UPI0003811B65|nr:DUF2795 domain-containing protein [Sciscionella marina]